jgi:hypothetical protein
VSSSHTALVRGESAVPHELQGAAQRRPISLRAIRPSVTQEAEGCNERHALTHVPPVNHAVNSAALEREMMLRGWTGADLARESRLSAATVSAALAGRPIAVSSVLLIAQALMRCPMVAMGDSLLPEHPRRRDRPSSPRFTPTTS